MLTGGGSMLLLSKIGKPSNLLAKARRDATKLLDCEQNGLEQPIGDALFNFAITAYHLRDWLLAYPKKIDSTIVNAVYEQAPCLNACRDIANASKHCKITRYDPSTRAVTKETNILKTLEKTDTTITYLTEAPTIIIMSDGTRMRLNDFAEDVMSTLESLCAKMREP